MIKMPGIADPSSSVMVFFLSFFKGFFTLFRLLSFVSTPFSTPFWATTKKKESFFCLNPYNSCHDEEGKKKGDTKNKTTTKRNKLTIGWHHCVKTHKPKVVRGERLSLLHALICFQTSSTSSLFIFWMLFMSCPLFAGGIGLGFFRVTQKNSATPRKKHSFLGERFHLPPYLPL